MEAVRSATSRKKNATRAVKLACLTNDITVLFRSGVYRSRYRAFHGFKQDNSEVYITDTLCVQAFFRFYTFPEVA